MGVMEKASYWLLKKNEYIGDFNEELQIGEEPISLKKKLAGGAYMVARLYHPRYRSEVFEYKRISFQDFDKLKAQIDRCDVISFDIFDTLLLRPVYKPRDMFYFLEMDNEIIDFRKKRIQAEIFARKETEKPEGEINIFDIYKILQKWCDIDKDEWAKKEIALEETLCFAHPLGKKLYDYALEKKKIVIATSDMYIQAEYMKEILEKKGYDRFFDVFMSCDYGKSKRHNTLYQVLKQKWSDKKILHIGDNPYSDIYRAKRSGLYTLHLPNVNKQGEPFRRFQNQSFMSSVYCGLADAYLHTGDFQYKDGLYKNHYLYGFLCGGILTYGLCQWINQVAYRKQADKILFLARDGYIVSQIYEKYFHNLKSGYVAASRQALLPVICAVDYDLFLKEAFYKRLVYSKMTMKEALEDIGLWGRMSADLQKEANELMKNSAYSWYLFKTWMVEKKDVIRDCYQSSLQAINRYYEEQIGQSKTICIFDLGWRGTSVLCLKKYLEKTHKGLTVYGVMVGAQEMPMTDIPVKKGEIEAYVFSEENPTRYSRINGQKVMYLKERFALEFLFTSTEASLLAYEDNNGKTKCIYEQKDTGSNQIIVDSIHEGIRDFCDFYYEKIGRRFPGLQVGIKAAYLPMWQIVSNKKIMKLFQQYNERETTLHGFSVKDKG